MDRVHAQERVTRRTRTNPDRDFLRLWHGLAVSQFGSAIGTTAVPVVAVAVLHEPTSRVSALAAIASLTVAVCALPVGADVEFRRKRPAMVLADLTRLVATASVPIVYLTGGLTYAQLCVVAAVNAFGTALFASASQAHLVALVSRERLLEANGQLQSTTWLSLSIGPSLAGVIISAVNAVGAMALDAVSFVASAAAVLRIRRPEPEPEVRDPAVPRRHDVRRGIAFVWDDGRLRRLLIGWVLFAGLSAAASPLTSVLYLRQLHFTGWQYGLILGPPSLAGFAGSRLAHRLSRRHGPERTIRVASMLRAPWFVLIAFAVRGGVGVAMCSVGFGAVLFFSSIANSTMTGYRQLLTPHGLLARVRALWSFATVAAQPLFILAAGIAGQAAGLRPTLLVIAGLMLASAIALPVRRVELS